MQPTSRILGPTLTGFLLASLTAREVSGQAGTVLSEQKINELSGGFGGVLDSGDVFGASAAALGDLDGDGIEDLVVGAYQDGDGGSGRGAVWILFLDTDGTVKSEQKISSTSGGFGGALDNDDDFGYSVTSLGDLDGDGIGDLAVGTVWDDDGGSNKGAVWILFLDTDGTVKSEQKISESSGGFGGALDAGGQFGAALASLGDLDGDGIGDLAVGAELSVEGGEVWILFLDTDGTVKSQQVISEGSGGFGGDLDGGDSFGRYMAPLGDLDGNGVEDLAAGAIHDDDGGFDRGAIWILFLDTDGTVLSEQKISTLEGFFAGPLDNEDLFGLGLASIGDLDGDGIVDLAAGAILDDDGGGDRGAVWILFLDTDGTVQSEHKISASAGGFGGSIDPNDQFGYSIAAVGDLDGGGTIELAVGEPLDDDGSPNEGAVWILFLETDTVDPLITCPSDITTEGTGPSGATVSFTVSASDDRDPTPTIVCVPPSGSTFPLGTTTVACTATDNAGNSALCSFDVTVEDTTAPLLVCPADILVRATKAELPAVPVSFTPTVSDLCDVAPALVCVPPSGSLFPLGTTTVTCTATDDSGNVSMCTFQVTVEATVRRRRL